MWKAHATESGLKKWQLLSGGSRSGKERKTSLSSLLSHIHTHPASLVFSLLNKAGKPDLAKIIPLSKLWGKNYLLYQQHTLLSASSGLAPGWRSGFFFFFTPSRYLQCKPWMMGRGTQPVPRNLRKELTLGLHTVTHTVLEWKQSSIEILC